MATNLTLDGQTHYAICIALTTLWMRLLAEHTDQRTLPSGERNASLFHILLTLHITHGLGQMDTGKGVVERVTPLLSVVSLVTLV